MDEDSMMGASVRNEPDPKPPPPLPIPGMRPPLAISRLRCCISLAFRRMWSRASFSCVWKEKMRHGWGQINRCQCSWQPDWPYCPMLTLNFRTRTQHPKKGHPPPPPPPKKKNPLPMNCIAEVDKSQEKDSKGRQFTRSIFRVAFSLMFHNGGQGIHALW